MEQACAATIVKHHIQESTTVESRIVTWQQQELQKNVELSGITSRILIGRSCDRTGWEHLIRTPIPRTMQDSCDWTIADACATDVHASQAVYICSECRQSTLRGRTRIKTRLEARMLESTETGRGLRLSSGRWINTRETSPTGRRGRQ
jgi:hypothetical protein